MGEYIKNKKDMKFQSQEALKQVESVLNEANTGIYDKSRIIRTSNISDVLAHTLIVSTGGLGATSFVALSGLGLVATVASLGLLAGPAVIGIGIVAHAKNKKLMEAKELCYKETIKKQSAIIDALRKEMYADKERIEYLTSLNILLQSAIRDLQYDLGIA